MNAKLKEKILESLSAVFPITIIVLFLCVFVVPLEIGPVVMFLCSAVMLVFGMGIFQLGSEIAMGPLGEGIGKQLSKTKQLFLIIGTSLLLGVIITIAEPDLQVLAQQIPSIPNSTLIWIVAIGVGLFLALAVLRIVLNADLSILLIILYGILLILAFFIPKNFLAIAFDSGGVTTGPITVPFIMTLGVGIFSIRGDKNASDDSFGLVALSSIGPILATMILGFFYKTDSVTVESTRIPEVFTMRDVFFGFFSALPHYAKEVAISILPLLGVYAVYQLAFRHFHKRQRQRILMGFIYTYIGLVLFLCGVNVGFAPVGALLGKEMAALNNRWLLVPIGMLIGYFIVKAEPAIQVLNHQVQTVTNGLVDAGSMNLALSVGVSVSVGISVLRVLTGIPIIYTLIPGYLLALIMTRFVPKVFVGIAFDSGGVASGPMTSTFLLPLCLGICETLGGDIMTDAFGIVAMVAMTPLIAIQIMGISYRIKMAKVRSSGSMASFADDCDSIILFEEA